MPDDSRTNDDDPLSHLRIEVLRLVGTTAAGRLAYAADAVVDGDREAARCRAGARLTQALQTPLGLWPPAAPDTEVWVTAKLERGAADGGAATTVATAQYVATVAGLGAAAVEGGRDLVP